MNIGRWVAVVWLVAGGVCFGASSKGEPDLLKGMKSAGEWVGERQKLIGLFEEWWWGRVPGAPRKVEATVLSEEVTGGVVVRKVLLSFGKAALHVEVMIPGGGKKVPLFLTQRTQRAWALIAVRRGYAACVYDASDGNDDSDSLKAEYPGYDFAQLARRAFMGGRALDYCLGLPEVDAAKVVLAGHSRNGKQALILGALDERIAVVISGSSGLGGAAAARFQGEPQSAESVESMTARFTEWYTPRLKTFAGREDELPVDANALLALVAPRVCLISTAMNDPYEMGPAVERGYLGALPVYKLLGVEKNLVPSWRAGGHEISAEVVEGYLDFCDARFGRGGKDVVARLPFPVEGGDPPTASVAESLGERPARVATTQSLQSYGQDPAYVSSLLNRLATTKPVDYERVGVTFGEYLAGDVYFPAGARESGKKWPAVLYLHPFSTSRGYSGSMGMILGLVRKGFVVMAFDQVGHGARVMEAERFYERNAGWSLMGKMVEDSRDALGVLVGQACVDEKRVYAVGYSLGATVGLQLMAGGETRLAGGAFASPSVNGAGSAGGIRLYAREPGYGVGELVGACQPRPMLLVTPSRDWNGEGVDVEYPGLTRVAPEGFDRFNTSIQKLIVDWLLKQ